MDLGPSPVPVGRVFPRQPTGHQPLPVRHGRDQFAETIVENGDSTGRMVETSQPIPVIVRRAPGVRITIPRRLFYAAPER